MLTDTQVEGVKRIARAAVRWFVVRTAFAVVLVGCTSSNEPLPDVSVDAAPDANVADTGEADAAADVDTEADLPPDAADAADLDGGEPAGPWRSTLYPEDWSFGFTDAGGRALHDFSYAGYRYGEEPPTVLVTTFSVADFGADPTGTTDSHPAFVAAIDVASVAGGVVFVPAGLYRIDDQLRITASNVVLRGEGAATSRLWFTRFDEMSSRSHVTFAGAPSQPTETVLTADAASGDRILHVADAASIAVGADVVVGWTISAAFIDEHEMTNVWVAFNDTWQPFFRREVVATDPAAGTIELDLPVRYRAKMRDQASVRVESGLLEEVGVESLGVADAVGWEDAWSQTQVHVIELSNVVDAWVRDVASFESPGAPSTGDGAGAHLQNGGIIVRGSKRVTVADSRLELAQNRGGGGCGYLFEVRQSSEVLFRDLVARAGRHNFIQNWGFGTSGIVWLRVHSSEGRTFAEIDAPISVIGDSEFHHSLAMANLIDSSTFEDGFAAMNRKDESTGAGHTATETVFWNTSGGGRLRSYQWGHGYVIGTSPDLTVLNDLPGGPYTDEERAQLEQIGPWTSTWPIDWVEGKGRGADLQPPSLYEDQRRRRQ